MSSLRMPQAPGQSRPCGVTPSPRPHMRMTINHASESVRSEPGVSSGPGEAPPQPKPKADEDFLGTKELREELLSDQKGFGKRGEALTLAQVLCSLLVLFPPLKISGIVDFLALLLIVSGVTFAVYGLYSLGRSFSPLPTLRIKHSLVTKGAYAYCRHPLYGGLLMVAFGLAALTTSESRLLFALLLSLILHFKTKAEEAALLARYGAEYSSYQYKVARFIPYFF